MNIIFGTDGWRGLIDEEVNEKTMMQTAQAFAGYINNKYTSASAVVGYDGRRNSKVFAEIFSSVLSGNNIKVFLSNNITPTPVLSYFVKKHNLSAGVMITASHNPAEYNGIKFKAGYGGPFLTEETHKVEALLGKGKIVKSGTHIEQTDLLPCYLENIYSMVDLDIIRNSGVKVLVDSMGGAGQKIIESILKLKGIECETIFGEAREDFGGRYAEPIEKNLLPLSEKLKSGNKYSLGLATDGDADRLGVLLENGEWLSAQETILMLTDFILNHKKIEGDLVKTSSVTNKLKSNFEKPSRRVYDVQVGFKYICEKMISEDIAFGCEESGGYGYKGHIPERDGILSALFMTEMLAASGYNKISELTEAKREEFGRIFYDRIDYKYVGADRLEKLPALYEIMPLKIAGKAVTGTEKYFSSRGIINGLKFILEGDTRWLLMRTSETEPLVRIYAEGQSINETEKLLQEGKKLLINR